MVSSACFHAGTPPGGGILWRPILSAVAGVQGRAQFSGGLETRRLFFLQATQDDLVEILWNPLDKLRR